MMKIPTIFLLLLSTTLIAANAQAAQTKNIEGVSPRIGQRGTTVDVTIVGVSIHDPREIIFFTPGIRAIDLKTPETPPSRRGLAHGGRIEEAVTCRFVIAPDCTPGEHPFRLLTATELTCLGTFHVSPFPVIDEEEAAPRENDSIETAMSVACNTTVRATIGPWNHGDVDVYRVPVTAGQHLSVEVDSARLSDVHFGGSEFDLALQIVDEKGRELAANDDNSVHLQDPLASVLAPRDGDLFVRVMRSVFTTRRTAYCIHLSDQRQPLIAFPPGGTAGETQTFTMLGDPAGPYQQQITLPEGSGTLKHFGDAPSPVLIRYGDFPNVSEDPSASVTDLTSLDNIKPSGLRVAINGTIDSRDDSDSYRIRVAPGEPLHVRIYSASLGSPLDPRIQIRAIGDDGSPGKIELDLDDAKLDERDLFGTSYRGGGGQPAVLDPSTLWTPESDDDYLIEVSDSSGMGGTTGVYRIEIQPLPTVVQTVLSSRTFDWTESMRVSGLIVPQGNRWTCNLSLPRGQWKSVQGAFELIAHGLPDGVRLVAPPLNASETMWPVQLIADENAKPGGAVITLEAKPIDQPQTVETRSQQNVPFINHPGGNAWRAVHVDRYIMAVTKPAPFSIDIEEPSVALVRGGELSLPVTITRHNGFTGPVEFSVGYVDRSIDTPPDTVIPAGETRGLLQLSAKASAPLGPTPLVVIGNTINESIDPYLGAGQIRVSSEIVQLEVSEPFVELTAVAQSVRRGQRKSFVWDVRHKSPFEGEAQVKMLGLPKGVTAVQPLPVLTRETLHWECQLEATDEALLGQVSGLSCEVVVPVQQKRITQRTGKGSLRIDPAL